MWTDVGVLATEPGCGTLVVWPCQHHAKLPGKGGRLQALATALGRWTSGEPRLEKGRGRRIIGVGGSLASLGQQLRYILPGQTDRETSLCRSAVGPRVCEPQPRRIDWVRTVRRYGCATGCGGTRRGGGEVCRTRPENRRAAAATAAAAPLLSLLLIVAVG